MGALGKPDHERSKEHRARIARSDELVDELFDADVVVIAAAMINFSITSTLKAWIDHVARSSRTFRYDESGKPHGLVTGKRVILVQAKGGVYCDSPAQSIDFVTPYLRHMLGFMGMTDVETIHVEGTVLGKEATEKAVAGGIEKARAHVAALRSAA